MRISLENSLAPSLIGCIRPKSPTLLGPLRVIIYPNTFRSTSVNHPTAIKPNTPGKIKLITCITLLILIPFYAPFYSLTLQPAYFNKQIKSSSQNILQNFNIK